ncbi:MAG: hypothetical protein CEO21_179 [Microgenomates group bacterium Gr01-1014_80]|nr:MAG: hypothetical protein CEO21_179 [Microgenomates group bacterium Gr01-1014_80]
MEDLRQLVKKKKNIIQLLVLGILVLAVPVILSLVRQQQILKGRALGSPPVEVVGPVNRLTTLSNNRIGLITDIGQQALVDLRLTSNLGPPVGTITPSPTVTPAVTSTPTPSLTGPTATPTPTQSGPTRTPTPSPTLPAGAITYKISKNQNDLANSNCPAGSLAVCGVVNLTDVANRYVDVPVHLVDQLGVTSGAATPLWAQFFRNSQPFSVRFSNSITLTGSTPTATPSPTGMQESLCWTNGGRNQQSADNYCSQQHPLCLSSCNQYFSSTTLNISSDGCYSRNCTGAIVPTGINKDLTEAELTRLGSIIPIGRVGSPDEIATVAAFLGSDKTSYVTGTEWRVDDGLSIKNPLEVSQ